MHTRKIYLRMFNTNISFPRYRAMLDENLGKNGSGASETKHWQDMISKPRQTVIQWHRLKPE